MDIYGVQKNVLWSYIISNRYEFFSDVKKKFEGHLPTPEYRPEESPG